MLEALSSMAMAALAAGFPAAPAQEPSDRMPAMETVVYGVARTGQGDMELLADLYRPEGPITGAVILMHGGGFSGGSRGLEENLDYARALASRGYLAAAISYRLHADSPVVSNWAAEYARRVASIDDPRLVGAIEQLGPGFPDAVAAAAEDLTAAVSWLRRRAPDLGIDPADIAVFGASAGSITALTTVYASGFYGGEALDVAAVIDLRGLLIRPEEMGNPFRPEDPPLLILHGEDDRRVPLPDAEEVFALARAAGTSVGFYTAPGYGHDLGGAGLLALEVDDTRTVLDLMDGFLRAAFAPGGPAGDGLRGRLRRPGAGKDDPEAGEDPDGLQLVREELAAAARELLESVRAESNVVAALYRISKADMLRAALADPGRLDWSYWPRDREGLPLGRMNAAQRASTHRLLAALLSAKGYLQVNHIMMLEEILAGTESAGFARGVEHYVVRVFGEPTAAGPWGLRFEGHHVSLNVTVSPEALSVTPSFLGAAPAPLTAGMRAGFHPLRYEQRLAMALLESLDAGQRDAAILSRTPLSEIVTTQFRVDAAEWDRWQERLARDGVAASTFDAAQMELLRELVTEIASTYRDGIARRWLEALELRGLAFAWMGEAAAGRPHYFRLQGEDFVFEFDAAGGDGTHVHTVWRDRRGDFGADALREHYRRRAGDGGHGRGGANSLRPLLHQPGAPRATWQP